MSTALAWLHKFKYINGQYLKNLDQDVLKLISKPKLKDLDIVETYCNEELLEGFGFVLNDIDERGNDSIHALFRHENAKRMKLCKNHHINYNPLPHYLRKERAGEQGSRGAGEQGNKETRG